MCMVVPSSEMCVVAGKRVSTRVSNEGKGSLKARAGRFSPVRYICRELPFESRGLGHWDTHGIMDPCQIDQGS